MGASASIRPPSSIDGPMKALLADPVAIDALYENIAANQPEQVGRINLKGCVSVPELVVYFKNNSDPIFDGFCRNADIIIQAYKYVAEKTKKKKKKKNEQKTDQLTKKQFHLLLPTLFLYSQLWKIFERADISCADRRIFKPEWQQSRPLLALMDGVTISESLTDEDWDKVFGVIDTRKKDGYIEFRELCQFCCDSVITPEQYAEIIDDNGNEPDEPTSAAENEANAAAEELLVQADIANCGDGTGEAALENFLKEEIADAFEGLPSASTEGLVPDDNQGTA
jgi:hypothetical protein